MPILRLIAVMLALLALALQVRLHSGHGGRADVEQLAARVAAQRQENAVLDKRNAALAADVADLKTGTDAIEERARSELGMIKPGEVFYQVIDLGDAAKAPAP